MAMFLLSFLSLIPVNVGMEPFGICGLIWLFFLSDINMKSLDWLQCWQTQKSGLIFFDHNQFS